ncbi:MAG: hypothetical protein JXR52_06990 [Bacteroidales bacterium]|nr:hypothetical protein [Bacteroidales bacterium]MBN2698555.1 hypothetical protein [Bacteroidales bacterium]
MLKRFIYGGIFALVFTGLLLLVILKKTGSAAPASLFEIIPGNAIMIAEHLDFNYVSNELIDQNTIYNDLANLTGFSGADSLWRIFLEELARHDELDEILRKEQINLSLHLLGKDKIQPVFYVDYSDSYSQKDFVNLVTAFLGDASLINERRYEAETIYDVSCRSDYLPDQFSFAVIKGIFILSPSSILLEESIRGSNAGNGFFNEREFLQVKSTSGRYVYANLYLNYSRLPQLFYPFVDHNCWSRLEGLEKFASWGELDLDVKDDAIILNGMTSVADSIPLFLGSSVEQSPVKVEMTSLFPSNTFYFLHLGIDKKESFHKRMLMVLAEQGERVQFDEETDRIKRLYGLDPFGDLLDILDNEIGWFAVEGSNDRLTSEICVVEVRSGSQAREKLHKWYSQYLSANRFEPSSLLYQYKLDNQTIFDIYRLPDLFYQNQKAGSFFNHYYTVYDKYILFGPSIESLSAVIYQNILRKTLDNDPVFQEVSNFFSSRANVSVYIKPFAYLQNNRSLLKQEMDGIIGESEPFLRKISGMVIQYSREDNMFYNNVTLKYTSQIKERALTVWESLLDTVAFLKPSLVTNHNTSEKEIFLQDANHKIYLINGTGRILWSLQLESPILSEIYQIDFYRNNKLQFLFNTKEKLHLIDRNGNYVERYPINLRAHATNPMALFDYDNSRDYRIFVAGIDRKIYLYDKEGSIITDWKFRKTDGILSKPLQHFRINDRDYIIATGPQRVYILDRRGRERINPEKWIAISHSNLLYLDMNIRDGKPRWISSDTTGNIVAIYTGGDVETLVQRKADPDHFFCLQDMDRDGVPDCLITEGNELMLLKLTGEPLFSFKTKGAVTQQPDIYKFSASDIKIGLTDNENDRIYLINSDGSLHEGFPLDGSTRFSIGYFAGSDSRFNLIVGSSNGFLYNYSIE